MRAAAAAVGFPLLVKAVAGGGGKGMRSVDRPDDLLGAIRTARSEAGSVRSDAHSERSAHTRKTSKTHRSKTVKESSSSSRRKEKEPSLMKQLFRSKTAVY